MEPQRILDLGTGAGDWAIDMADKFLTVQVIGVDLGPIQPSLVPPSLQFEVDNVEDQWECSKAKVGFTYTRNLMIAVWDWDLLTEQSLAHLKSGGYLEISPRTARMPSFCVRCAV
jgi:hypothetical protein